MEAFKLGIIYLERVIEQKDLGLVECWHPRSLNTDSLA